jgi:hypothetical protein
MAGCTVKAPQLNDKSLTIDQEQVKSTSKTHQKQST